MIAPHSRTKTERRKTAQHAAMVLDGYKRNVSDVSTRSQVLALSRVVGDIRRLAVLEGMPETVLGDLQRAAQTMVALAPMASR